MVRRRLPSCRVTALAAGVLAGGLLAACGGGGSDPPAAAASVPALPAAASVSTASPVAAGCTGGSASGRFFANAEVEPFVAAEPNRPDHLVATWQQDRWSDGGARAIVTAASFDGGRSWTRVLQPMSRCGGGSAGNGGDFERISDPWVDIAPDGTAHAMGLAFSGNAGASSRNAMVASRSADGGLTWSAPATLIDDDADFFNDKNALTADPTDARYVYAVWDRIDNRNGGGPTMFARSVDSGLSWQPARAIQPAVRTAQSIGNRIVVIPDGPERGMLVVVYTEIDTAGGAARMRLELMRSSDQGDTWSAPIRIAELQSVGTRDPTTRTPVRDGALLGSVAAGPGGALWVAWQDARFSGGRFDAIALARSTDGGLTWSAPVAINRDASVAAFTPAISVRADGLVGVLHHDLRPDTSDPATLLAGAWLLSSRDGSTWVETPVWSPFDLAGAPRVSAGYFLGDYQGMVATAGGFLPVLALSRADEADPSDVFALPIDGLALGGRAAPLAWHTHVARGSIGPAPLLRERVHANVVQAMEQRRPGWAQRFGLGPQPVSPSR